MFKTTMLVLSLASAAVPAAAQVAPGPPVIVAQGSGLIKRAPDQGWVTIAAETRAASPAEAQRLAAEAMTSVMKALAPIGLAADAIKTTAYSLRPDLEHTNGRTRVRGYIARNEIEVRVDDLTQIARVIDAAGSAGATQMAGLRFDVKERAALEQEALKLAVQDALARARAMAAGAGVSLGPIERIDEGGGGRPQPMAFRTAMASEAADTPVTPGDIEIRTDVTVAVRIRQQ